MANLEEYILINMGADSDDEDDEVVEHIRPRPRHQVTHAKAFSMRWTNQPLQSYMYMDVTKSPFFEFVFIKQCSAQVFVGLALGQLGVFFAANSILICGQLDLLCCSLRNVRFTALLHNGVRYKSIKTSYSDIRNDELFNYIYNVSELAPSSYHYDRKLVRNILSCEQYDEATCSALRDCARLYQMVNQYKLMFERFVSPLLALRVVQVTLYLCMLLYSATLKFDMVTVEYLLAVALDIFVYCFYGNQIITQADRVSTATFQSGWASAGPRARRLVALALLGGRRPVIVRAARFLPLHLNTFLAIIKTSFSYYTLLVSVNEK
ncbi:hypothetical protein ACJJTC_005983 [Scirpophaga incertulas]